MTGIYRNLQVISLNEEVKIIPHRQRRSILCRYNEFNLSGSGVISYVPHELTNFLNRHEVFWRQRSKSLFRVKG